MNAVSMSMGKRTDINAKPSSQNSSGKHRPIKSHAANSIAAGLHSTNNTNCFNYRPQIQPQNVLYRPLHKNFNASRIALSGMPAAKASWRVADFASSQWTRMEVDLPEREEVAGRVNGLTRWL